MASRKTATRSERYGDVLENLIKNLPSLTGKMDVGMMDEHIVDVGVTVTPAYKKWLVGKKGKDVPDVQFQDQSLVFAPAKHAVQFVIMRTVGVVKQLLHGGVDPLVAIGLLPEELATMVHREYKQRYG